MKKIVAFLGIALMSLMILTGGAAAVTKNLDVAKAEVPTHNSGDPSCQNPTDATLA